VGTGTGSQTTGMTELSHSDSNMGTGQLPNCALTLQLLLAASTEGNSGRTDLDLRVDSGQEVTL
jgi:hypothetical protein